MADKAFFSARDDRRQRWPGRRSSAHPQVESYGSGITLLGDSDQSRCKTCGKRTGISQTSFAGRADRRRGLRASVYNWQPRCRAVTGCMEKGIPKSTVELHWQSDERRGHRYQGRARTAPIERKWLHAFRIAPWKPKRLGNAGGAMRKGAR